LENQNKEYQEQIHELQLTLQTTCQLNEVEQKESEKIKNILEKQILHHQLELKRLEEKLQDQLIKNNSLNQLIDQIQLKYEIEHKNNQILKKECLKHRSNLESELERTCNLTKELKKKDHKLEILEKEKNDKIKEITLLHDRFEREMKEEKSKKVALMNKINIMIEQQMEDAEKYKRDIKRSKKREKMLREEANSDFESCLELKKKNRDLQRELRLTINKYETEISKMKEIIYKTTNFRALSFMQHF